MHLYEDNIQELYRLIDKTMEFPKNEPLHLQVGELRAEMSRYGSLRQHAAKLRAWDKINKCAGKVRSLLDAAICTGKSDARS